jgi:hypothetical protein
MSYKRFNIDSRSVIHTVEKDDRTGDIFSHDLGNAVLGAMPPKLVYADSEFNDFPVNLITPDVRSQQREFLRIVRGGLKGARFRRFGGARGPVAPVSRARFFLGHTRSPDLFAVRA